ncbi:hypothetical protein GN244_ATG09463 [Phytophthora infestans]|uniref:Uncharacterized protein n=1 Tax=Phytophthora infestans TaxID=4787 RepID=A0A833WUX4_PHYIN|nr:hypothetical protein GN244_ATG09463 [Phytophthora infestans]KAF4143366.1 hypothetical protein GN958_ATG07432 [Phytophthora infestans]
MEALYERVLVLVPPKELQATSNLILQEEFLALDDALNNVLAAFLKLEEVRSAVSKLEQSSTVRSSSLLKAIERTIAVQQQLEKRLQKIVASSSVSATLDKHKDPITTIDPVTEAQNHEESDSESKSEECSHRLLLLESKDHTSRTLTSRVNDAKRSVHTPNEVDATTRKRKIKVKPPRYYMDRVKEVDALPPKERLLSIPHLLRELTVFLEEDTSYGQRFRFTSFLQDILRWISQMAGERQHLEMFLDFTDRVKHFVSKLPHTAQTLGLQRLTDTLSDAVHGKPISFGKVRPRRPRRG